MKGYRFRLENPGEMDLAGLIERLGAIIACYRGTRTSTHERTKEVWGALQTLLKLSEKKWREWIPLIVDQFDPGFRDTEVNEYFKLLVRALLEKFADEARGYNPAMKRLLARSIRSALDSASSSPYPQICFFINEFNPKCIYMFKDKCKEVLDRG